MQTQYQHNSASGLPDPELDAQFYENVPAKRLLAWVIDFVIITVITFVVALFSVGIFFFFFIGVWAVVGFFYRVVTISIGSATWGMRLSGLELRTATGDRFSSMDALAHTILFYLLNMMPIGLLISMVMMLVTARRQGLHDFVMGSTAINRPADF